MKQYLLPIALGACAIFASPAKAADVYTSGGMKDAPELSSASGVNHSGFAVRAFIGYAWGNRDVDTSARAFLNCVNAYEVETDPELRAKQLDEISGALAEYKAAGIFASNEETATAGRFIVPLIGALFSNSGSDEFGGLVFGGEVEHLWHRGQFGLGLAAGVTFYGDAETKTSFAGAPTTFAPGTVFTAMIPQAVGEETGLTVSGFTTVDRDFDIDFTLKGYWFAAQDTAFYLKAGPSIARASIKSSIGIDGTSAGMSYSDSDTAIGYVVGLGVIHWINPNLSVSLDGDFKQHSFSAEGSKNVKLGEGYCCDSYEVQAKGKTDVDDSVFAIKASAAYHF